MSKLQRFFESQLLLLTELEAYLNVHHEGSHEFFPDPADVLKNECIQLHDLIRIHGGKTLLAHKFGMKFAWDDDDRRTSNNPNSNNNLNWGPFNVGFAIQLLRFIRDETYLSLSPPLSSAHISMPTEKDLVRCRQEELAKQVVTFGGYENVARRLGLAFFDDWMEEERYQEAKILWKERYNNGVLPNHAGKRRKRKGLAWDEDLVVDEL